MKTVRPPKRSNKYHIKCNNIECDAIMECDADEIGLDHDRGGSFYVMKCPRCLRRTLIEPDELRRFKVGY